MKAINIKWDVTDGDMTQEEMNEILETLPTEVDVPYHLVNNEDDYVEVVSDWLSDEFGYCHDGFELIMCDDKVFENQNGYIMENKEYGYIVIIGKVVRNSDGLIEPHHNETRINYKTGLFQSWTSSEYAEIYYDWCKDRNAVISHGKRMLTI